MSNTNNIEKNKSKSFEIIHNGDHVVLKFNDPFTSIELMECFTMIAQELDQRMDKIYRKNELLDSTINT